MARPASTFDGDEKLERLPGDFKRSKTGTPYVADPTGALVKPKRKSDPPRVKTVAYGRPSSFGKQIEDTYNLQKWSERTVALGIAVDPGLIELCAALVGRDRDSAEWKADADLIVVRAKDAAQAALAAERGTHAHAITDDTEGDWLTLAERGELLGLSVEVQTALVKAFRDMLERDGLEVLATEAAVVHDGYRKAGKLDHIVRLTKPLRFTLVTGEIVELEAGRIPVLDKKTGQRRLDPHGVVMYWQSYAVQIATYAGAVPYDTETDTRGEWPFEIDQRWALIAHLDVLGAIEGRPSCELVLVDLEAGREAAELCLAAKSWESRSDVFSVSQVADAPGIVGDVVDHLQALLDAGTLDADQLGAVIKALKFPVVDDPASVDEQAAEEESAPTPTSSATIVAGGGDVREDVEDVPPAGQPAQAVSDSSTVEALPHPPATLTPAEQIGQVPINPDEGGTADEATCAALKAQYKALGDDDRQWVARLAHEAQQALVPFHLLDNHTIRRFEILRGLVALAAQSCADDVTLRALLGLQLGDVAHFDAVTPGHALGSLTAVQAAEFASNASGGDQVSQHTAA